MGVKNIGFKWQSGGVDAVNTLCASVTQTRFERRAMHLKKESLPAFSNPRLEINVCLV